MSEIEKELERLEYFTFRADYDGQALIAEVRLLREGLRRLGSALTESLLRPDRKLGEP